MKAIHIHEKEEIKGISEENLGFFLANNLGGYTMLFAKPFTRYQGVFYYNNEKMYKILDEIRIHGEVKQIINHHYYVERKRNGNSEHFFMPNGYNAIIYELIEPKDIELIFDVKQSYDNREQGRYYEIFEEDDKIIVKFTKKTDSKEDSSHDKFEYDMYVAIKPVDYYKKSNKWELISYEYDKYRNSQPFQRHVCNALMLNADKLVISFSSSKEEAKKQADFVYANSLDLKESARKDFEKLKYKVAEKSEISMAYLSAMSSLKKLLVGDNKIFAGLPWFFQFWSRDEIISTKALMSNNELKTAKNILFKYLNQIQPDGRLINVNPSFNKENLGNADSIGWLFLRLEQFIDAVRKQDLAVELLPKEDLDLISKKLELAIKNIEKNYMKDGLIHSSKNETWMDTAYKDTGREGFRLEIQALMLRMYRLIYTLTDNNDYLQKENKLKRLVYENFYNKKYLKDGIGDETIRPNIFLAYYIYPKLLSDEEWQKCFKFILPRLWLGWGGFATIDKTNQLFKDHYTGENNESYHRGDSWFWINNIAAICLYKNNKELFKKYIKKILDASTEEILWHSIIGASAELSSASILKSEGSLIQAWSNSAYIEMVEELF